MNRFPDCGEFDVEGSASPWRGANVDFAGMFFDDSITYAETESGSPASRLRREERIENLMDVLTRNSVTRVNDFDFYGTIVRRGPDF
jgi:hypothetical protein